MDPAELHAFRDVTANLPGLIDGLARQQAISGEHSQGLQALGGAIHTIQGQLQNLTMLVQQGIPSPPSTRPGATPPVSGSTSGRDEIRLPHPERYDGNMGKCKHFLTQCTIAFQLQPRFFPNDRAKVAYIVSLLTGKALAWASPAWDQDEDFCRDLDEFMKEMKKVFDHPVAGREASKGLVTIRQGKRSVADYAVDFRTLAVEVGWDDAPLITLFEEGLNAEVKDDLTTKEIPDVLDEYIDLAIRVDNRIRERTRERSRVGASGTRSSSGESRADPRPLPTTGHEATPPSTTPRSEPMQLGRAKLSKEEREHRRKMGLCLYCGQGDHFLSSCPSVPPKGQAQQ